MAIFVQSPAGFAWIWPYSSDPRRVFGENGHIYPILAGFLVDMVISVQYPPGFQRIWPYLSNPCRVFGEYGHICSILGGFCVKMAISVQSSAGFAFIHTIFNGYLSRFVWHWSHPSNPRRVSHTPIQILMVSRRDGVGRKDIHPKTCQVSDSSNKWESNFWSVYVGAYCIRPRTYRVWDSSSEVESNFWSVWVGAYCIRPSTYQADQSFAYNHGYLWSVCNTPLHGQSNFRREFDSINTYLSGIYPV